MRTERNPYPIPSLTFFLFMAGFGASEGALINLLHAPFWAFYLAPFLMGPFLIWELLRLDATYHRNEEARSPEAHRSRNSRHVTGASGS